MWMREARSSLCNQTHKGWSGAVRGLELKSLGLGSRPSVALHSGRQSVLERALLAGVACPGSETQAPVLPIIRAALLVAVEVQSAVAWRSEVLREGIERQAGDGIVE